VLIRSGLLRLAFRLPLLGQDGRLESQPVDDARQQREGLGRVDFGPERELRAVHDWAVLERPWQDRARPQRL
jgi:hypothetical protein